VNLLPHTGHPLGCPVVFPGVRQLARHPPGNTARLAERLELLTHKHCRGAVLPYHEFASADRLTDEQWRKLLDSSAAPEPPKWVQEWTVPKK
jgi:hypothetical protein